MEITFRLATESDKETLIAQFDHYNNIIYQEKRAECYINHNSTLFMVIDGKIVGRVQWYVKEDPRLGVVELEEVFIEKNYRNKGFGYKIIERAISIIENNLGQLNSIFLFIGEQDFAMQKIMANMGFKKIAEIADLFKKEEIVFFYLKSF